MTGPERRGTTSVLVAILAIGALRGSPSRAPRARSLGSGGTWIETTGDVARPGLHRLARSSSVTRALSKVGAACRPSDRRVLRGGERVRVRQGRRCEVRISTLPARVRLVLGIALDPNRERPDDLARLPGVGPHLAEAIVRGRPYATVDEMERVKGIGPKNIAVLRPLLRIGP